MTLLAKNVAINAIYYAATVILLPALLLRLESHLGLRPWFHGSRLVAVVLAVSGIVLQAWCIALFHRRGRGTASPVVPTRVLVTIGPYSLIRNPLNVGEVLLFLSLAAWFGSLALVAYALLAWVAFHLFVVHYEEPQLARKFGSQHESYRALVNRWLPRIRRTP